MIRLLFLQGLFVGFLPLVVSTTYAPTSSPTVITEDSDNVEIRDLLEEHGIWIVFGIGIGIVLSGWLYYVAHLAKLCEGIDCHIDDDDLPSDYHISGCHYRLRTDDDKSKCDSKSLEDDIENDVIQENAYSTIS